MTLHYSTAFSAKIPEKPESREDDHFVIAHKNIFAVLDGIGGLGDDAQFSSRLVKEHLLAYFENISEDVCLHESLEFLKKDLVTMNQKWSAEAKDMGRDFGTTLSLVHFFEKENTTFCENFLIGDSPITMLKNGGTRLEPVCLVDGAMIHKFQNEFGLSKETLLQIENFEYGQVLDWNIPKTVDIQTLLSLYFSQRHFIDNCFGSSQFQVHFGSCVIEEGDIVVIESDGTSDVLTLEERTDIVRTSRNEDCAQKIIDSTFEKQQQIDEGKIQSIRSKRCDDKTVIVIRN